MKIVVIQLRTQDVSPAAMGPVIIRALGLFTEHLSRGALVSLDEHRARVRILPLR